MADDKRKPSGQAGRTGHGRRGPPPTIDLKATEVAAAEPSPPPTSPRPEAASEEAAPTPEPEYAAAATGNASAETDEATAAGTPPRSVSPWLMLVSAAGGGAIVAIALLLVWGLAPSSKGDPAQAARVDKLEAAVRDMAVRDMAAREPPAAPDPNAVAALSERIAQLEATRSASAPSAQNFPSEDRLSAIEKNITALSGETAALKRRGDATAAAAEAAQRRADAAATRAESVQTAGAQGAMVDRKDIAAQSDRLTALERIAQTLQADVAQQKISLTQFQAALAKRLDAGAGERAVRLALVAEMLKVAVTRGDSFRAEFDAARALVPDQAALAPLAPFADTGVPTATALAQKLRAALPAMRRTAEPESPGDTGFLKRLQVNAEKLVRIQPIGERAGDTADVVLARIDVKAGRGDIAGVQAEIERLPAGVRAPAAEWIKMALARQAAIDASQRFAAAHITALGGRSE